MRDFFRFLFMCSVILFGLSLVWFGLYFYGSSKPTSLYQTELVKSLLKEQPLLIHQAIPFKKGQSTKPFMAVKIFYGQDDWLLRAEPHNIPFSTFLKKQSNTTLFVHLRLSRTARAAALKELVDQNDHWKKIVFVSDSDGTLKDLRELNPRWTFNTGEVFLTRFLSLASLGLHSLLEIPGDVFLINPKIFPLEGLSKVLEEARKQNKLVIIGPVNSALELPGIHGWVLVKD